MRKRIVEKGIVRWVGEPISTSDYIGKNSKRPDRPKARDYNKVGVVGIYIKYLTETNKEYVTARSMADAVGLKRCTQLDRLTGLMTKRGFKVKKPTRYQQNKAGVKVGNVQTNIIDVHKMQRALDNETFSFEEYWEK